MDKRERNRQRRDEDRRRENRLALILALPIAALMTILIVFAIGDEWKRQEKEAVKPEPIVIENPDPCNTGSIVIYANGGVYSFYGKFDIENDGKNGEEVEITLGGYMVAGYPHGEPEAPEIYGP